MSKIDLKEKGYQVINNCIPLSLINNIKIAFDHFSHSLIQKWDETIEYYERTI
jgi:hypothetical protein